MDLVVYTSTGEVRYPAEKQDNSKYKRRGEDLVEDGSHKVYVDIENGYVRGWFEETSPIQQRFFEFAGSKNSPERLRKELSKALKNYFRSEKFGFTDNNWNNFLKEYLAESETIDLPHSKSSYEKEIEKEGYTFITASSQSSTLKAARELSRAFNNADYMAFNLRGELNQKKLKRVTSSTSFRSAPIIFATPKRRAKDGEKLALYMERKKSNSRTSKTRGKNNGSKLNPLNWF